VYCELKGDRGREGSPGLPGIDGLPGTDGRQVCTLNIHGQLIWINIGVLQFEIRLFCARSPHL